MIALSRPDLWHPGFPPLLLNPGCCAVLPCPALPCPCCVLLLKTPVWLAPPTYVWGGSPDNSGWWPRDWSHQRSWPLQNRLQILEQDAWSLNPHPERNIFSFSNQALQEYLHFRPTSMGPPPKPSSLFETAGLPLIPRVSPSTPAIWASKSMPKGISKMVSMVLFGSIHTPYLGLHEHAQR